MRIVNSNVLLGLSVFFLFCPHVEPLQLSNNLPKAVHKSVRDAVDQMYKIANPTRAVTMKRFYSQRKHGTPESESGLQYLGILAEPLIHLSRSVCREGKFTILDAFVAMEPPVKEQRYFSIQLLYFKFRQLTRTLYKFRKRPHGDEAVAANLQRDTLIKELVRRIPTHLHNWNLMETSIATILGDYVVNDASQASILYTLAQSNNIWDRRSSLIATIPLVRRRRFEEFEKIAGDLIAIPDPGIHTVIVRVLREASKLDEQFVARFMRQHSRKLSLVNVRKSLELVSLPIEKELRAQRLAAYYAERGRKPKTVAHDGSAKDAA